MATVNLETIPVQVWTANAAALWLASVEVINTLWDARGMTTIAFCGAMVSLLSGTFCAFLRYRVAMYRAETDRLELIAGTAKPRLPKYGHEDQTD